ncbi:hypothetical protein OROGR_011186 [Orobanche gracilis]
MPNENARKCWQKGHNSRACSKACAGGIKLFGVRIDITGDENGVESSIRKSKSLGNLQTCSPENGITEPSGYLSDGFVHQSSKSHERKKGRPWSEEEHRSFLVGLEKLGKGDWKGIATNYVPTRNSSQVASHAQKYFIRMSATEKKRRRSSVFDIPLTDQYVNQPSSSQSDNKAAESSQPAIIRAASSKNIAEVKGQGSTTSPVTTCERPPLSPMRRHGVSDFRSMFYTPTRVSGFGQGFATQSIVRPTVAWVPFMTYSDKGSSNVFLPNTLGSLGPTCGTKFVSQSSLSVHKLGHKGSSSQTGGGHVVKATNDHELNINIRNLTL